MTLYSISYATPENFGGFGPTEFVRQVAATDIECAIRALRENVVGLISVKSVFVTSHIDIVDPESAKRAIEIAEMTK